MSKHAKIAATLWVFAGICSLFDGVPNGFQGFLTWSAWAFFLGFVLVGVVAVLESAKSKY